MSRENVDLIRGLIPPPDADLAALFRDETAFRQAVSALEALIHENVESVAVWRGARNTSGSRDSGGCGSIGSSPAPPTSRASKTRSMRAIASLSSLATAAGETRRTRRSRSSPRRVWDIRDGKVVRVEFFGNRGEALAAAGISE
jgi:hypothetical protein